MPPSRNSDYLVRLVAGLRALPHETEWVEFKGSVQEPSVIGEYISSLANAATLEGRPSAYLVWGIDDSTHELIGTTFKPADKKVGNENLENWLVRGLRPQVDFRFHTAVIDDKTVVVLEIDPATHTPIRFQEDEWIRVGSYKKRLREHPEHAKRLWRALEGNTFERSVAVSEIDDADILATIDYPAFFDLLNLPVPDNKALTLSALEQDEVISRSDDGSWNITNLGALLFAKDLSHFPSTARKPLRMIRYRGDSRVETIREQVGVRGYAVGFEGMVSYISNQLPANEVIGRAIRQSVPMYPELAIRELVANALIHQDLSQTGNGPMVEIFDGRIEITSPGDPLVKPERFIDAPPKSRNEALAAMMRRIGICEERGSGWDKIGFQVELHELPAPLVELPQSSTRVVLFGPKPLNQMDKEERIRAVYLHACLRYVTRQQMTNSSLRERFAIEQHNSAQASRLIAEAVEAGAVVPYDAAASKKYMRYVPAWAADDGGGMGRL